MRTKVHFVYVFDPMHYQTTVFNSRKTYEYKSQFLIESVEQLRKNLEKIDLSLLGQWLRRYLIIITFLKLHRYKYIYILLYIVAHEAPDVFFPKYISSLQTKSPLDTSKPSSVEMMVLHGLLPTVVMVAEEVTYEEVLVENNVDKQLKKVNAKLERVSSSYTLYHPDDLPFDKKLYNFPGFFIEIFFFTVNVNYNRYVFNTTV